MEKSRILLKPSICLICGNQSDLLFDSEGKRVTVKEENNEGASDKQTRNSNIVGTTNFKWEIDIYQFFRNYIKDLCSSPQQPQRNLKKPEWDLKKEPVPLCDLCKEQLFPLKEKYEELKRLEELVREGMCLMKEKMEACEEKFKEENVYQLDKRYYAVRSTLIGIGIKRFKGHINVESGSKRSKVGSLSKKRKKALKNKAPKKKKMEDLEKETEQVVASYGNSFDDTDLLGDDDNLSFPPTPVAEDEKQKAKSLPPPASTSNYSKKAKDIIVPSISKDQNPSRLLKKESNTVLTIQESTETNSLRRARRSSTKKAIYKDELDLDLDDLEEIGDDNFEMSDDDDKKRKKSRGHRKKVKYDDIKIPTRFKPRLEENGQYSYINHFFDVLGDERYQCTTCKAIMTTNNSMKVHVVNAHLTHKCPLPYCSFFGTRKPDVQLHYMKAHDKIESKRYCCDICGMPMGRPGQLRGHRRTHYGEEERRQAILRGEIKEIQSEESQHPCEFCGTQFKKKASLINHVRYCSHNEARLKDKIKDVNEEESEKHLCPQCGKAITTAKGLDRHMKQRHPDPKDWRELPFACIYCDKRFVREIDLKNHKIREHTKEFPYPCGQCEQKFMTKKNYDNHMMLHSGKRPFQCEFCPIGFAIKSNLDRHLKIYHSEGSKPRRTAFSKNPKKGFYRGRKLRETEEWGKVDFTCRDAPGSNPSNQEKIKSAEEGEQPPRETNCYME